MAYKKFELEPIPYGKRPYKKKHYFSEGSLPPAEHISGAAYKYRARMNGERVMPLLIFKAEPEKYVRKPPIEGIKDGYEAAITEKQLVAAHVKSLWAEGFSLKEIMSRLDVTYGFAYHVVIGRTFKKILPMGSGSV